MSVENLISQLRDAAKFTLADTLYSQAADKMEELAAENGRLRFDEGAYKSTIEFLKAENAALKYQNEVRQDLINELRSAGGKDEPCRGCGDGDKVPASGYWRCPVCDAEWSGEDAE